MYGPTGEDEFDWEGCEVVQWDPEKLHGRANVAGTRMFADFILDFADSGMSVDEIVDHYGTESTCSPSSASLQVSAYGQLLEGITRQQHA